MQQGEFAIDQTDEEFSDAVFTIDTLIQLEAEFVGIDRAIEALQRGTYGLCEVCSTRIAPGRLRSDPVLVRCDDHIVRETPALFATETEFIGAQTLDPETVDAETVDAEPVDAETLDAETTGQYSGSSAISL